MCDSLNLHQCRCPGICQTSCCCVLYGMHHSAIGKLWKRPNHNCTHAVYSPCRCRSAGLFWTSLMACRICMAWDCCTRAPPPPSPPPRAPACARARGADPNCTWRLAFAFASEGHTLQEEAAIIFLALLACLLGIAVASLFLCIGPSDLCASYRSVSRLETTIAVMQGPEATEHPAQVYHH